MVRPVHHFSADELQLLLADQLNEPEQEEASRHLEQCESCRQALEHLAADPLWWNDASHLLKSLAAANAGEGGSGRGDGGQSGSSVAEYFSGVERGPLEFALDFLEPSDNPAMLGRLGEYEILELIGRGGMGVVLKGYQRELNRFVAIKVMAPHYAGSSAARKRFVREARAAAAVVHPHVAAIHGVDSQARLPYLVMPFIAARSLQQIIDEQSPLELEEILRVAKQTAEGLAAAHAQGLVHRDVKPANILLEDEVGRVLLTDFGLARAIDDATMTRSGVIAGTPQYMSPEQAHGETIDHRSDLFSLGSVIYAMATGHPPFRAETTMGILRRICEDPPRPVNDVNPRLPAWFSRLVDGLLEKDPDQRFQSAAQVAELLEQCLAHLRQPTTTSLPAELESRCDAAAGEHHPVLVRAGVAAGAALALILTIALVSQLDWSRGVENRGSTGSADVRRSEQQPPSNFQIPTSPPADAWDDGSSRLLEDLDRDIGELEEEIESTWEGTTMDDH